MRFAAYEHQHRRRVAVVDEDGTLYPVPGARSLTELIRSGEGLDALLAVGAATLDVPPGPPCPKCACSRRWSRRP